MIKTSSKRLLAFLLAAIMVIGIVPISAFAGGSVTNYADFMKDLKVLESYAAEYAGQIYGKDAGELVLNFIRTGVERYQDDNWETLAGQENTGFKSFVEAQDAEHGTTAMNLKNIVIDKFVLPNGNQVDFGHMFGCMNISYVAPGSADLSGWAGDICDLLQYSVAQINSIPGYSTGDVEAMAAYIMDNCFGVSASGAYGWDDFWGDMDGYYLVSEYKKGNGSFSQLMEAYFTAELNDIDRTVYFMNNRFAVKDSKEAVRKAIYEAYTSDVGLKILESKRGLSTYNALRQACCYAFADYVYSQSKGKLIEGTVSNDGPKNGYYSVFSNEHSILAPGVEQDINYAQTADGKQIVYYVATVDIKRDDLDLMVNYQNNLPPVAGQNIGMQRVEDQVAALVKNNKDKENFYPIVATNGAGYNITTGYPAGLVVMGGVEYNPISSPGFFAILKDGSAVIGDQEKYAELKEQGKVQEAIQAFGAILIKDGQINVTKNANYTSSRASRTAIGITDEGKVVMMVLDGRQLPRSAGGAMEEIAQIMLEAGCVQAVNLDGGGSTTYMSKPAGSDNIQVVNTPSDGYARSVATSLVVVSTAAPSTAFDHAIISSEYEYITAGTSMQFSVTGVSNTGNAAVIPAGSYWTTSDENIGTITADGVFTAVANGTAKVQYVVGGEVKGEKTINVIIPDDIKFVEDRITAVYGVPKEIQVTVWYQGNPVAFTPMMDMALLFSPGFDEEGNPILSSTAGSIDEMTFIGDDTNNVRTVSIVAALQAGEDIVVKYATVNLYKAGEATFDFENADQGNRKLAWNREIENAKSLDNMLYRISDPTSPIEIKYTFALDMTAIDFPVQLEPLKSMLPTYQEGATAWTYMLQLAERVCTQTNVTITAEFSKDLEVDISNLKVINDYFALTSANLDANNVLTLKCNWVNQSKPIDAATANPLCILTGVTATVKDTAAWFNNEILVSNNGYVSYDVYLAASSLYSFAQNTSNQAAYGLYPYIHEEDCRGDFSTDFGDDETLANNDKGARFSSQYIDFADIYVLDSEVRQGWYEEGSDYYYYVDNFPVTGTQLVTDRKDANVLRFYEFDETGKLVSEQGLTGLISFEGDLYYAVLGAVQTGWQVPDENTGHNYYFHPDTGKAVDGVQHIKEFIFPEVSDKDKNTATYTYTFENCILVRGDLRKDNIYGNTGWRYRWAGTWAKGCWFEVDGNTYHVEKNYPYTLTTGFAYYIHDFVSGDSTSSWLFDENGVLQKNFTGVANVTVNGTKRMICFQNGKVYTVFGLIKGTDGYYYYVNNNQEDGSWVDGEVITGQDFTVTVARGHGYINKEMKCSFDSQGRMTTSLINKATEIAVPSTAPVDKDDITVLGRVIEVTVSGGSAACKVVYKDGNTYVTAEATKTANGYSFATEVGATDIQFVVSGDVTGDGKIETTDIEELKNVILETEEAEEVSEVGKLAGDVNGDGKLTALDLALINASVKGKLNLGW